MSEVVILLDSLQIGSISLLVGYLCIPWCELPLWNINEKSSYLLSAHFILVCNFSSMITLADWYRNHLGAFRNSSWLWQT